MSNDELKGVALRIYFHILSARESLGIRDIARELGIPVSTVHYHIKKLKELGFIREFPEGYSVSKRIKVEGFIYLGGRLVPRLAIYSAFFAGIAVGLLSVSLIFWDINIDRLIAVISATISSVLTAFEAHIVRKNLFS
ncbi:MAG: winged helix-turn-helix domain-containing protein [Sulfolobales archaeon]